MSLVELVGGMTNYTILVFVIVGSPYIAYGMYVFLKCMVKRLHKKRVPS